MFNFSNNLESFITHRGLYRVWVPMHDDGKAPLVSIWIDPGMKAFEPQKGEEHIALSGVKGDDSIPEELVEPPGPCPLDRRLGDIRDHPVCDRFAGDPRQHIGYGLRSAYGRSNQASLGV
jgi:hypothetical protein